MVTRGLESKLVPFICELLGGIADIEGSKVVAGSRLRAPDYNLVGRNHGTIFRGMLIEGENFWIGQQRNRPTISRWKTAPDHQRRTEDAPQRHERALFVVRQAGLAWLAPAWCGAKISQGEHVCIGPVAWLGQPCPFRDITKLVSEPLRVRDIAVPEVPSIVGD